MGSAAPPPSGQSPVPYLFCALAAMLGLVGFALLLLGCSYWKLYVNSHDERRDVEEGDGAKAAAAPVVEEKYLVIMAGQERPTFLATASSVGTKSSSWSGSSENSLALEQNFEDKRGGDRQIEMGINESA